MNKLVLFFSIAVLLSCNTNNEKPNAEIQHSDKLTTENSKEPLIDLFLKDFNAVQENVRSIRLKQQSVLLSSQSKELQANQKEQIVGDVEFINNLLNQNRKTIDDLTKKLDEAKLENNEFHKTVFNLRTIVADQETEIKELNEKLSTLNLNLNAANTAFEKERKANEQLMFKINTGYCAIGTLKDLLAQGIVIQKGGVVGMGKVSDLDANVNKGMFSLIDIFKTTQIPVAAKEVKLITDHPKDSYTLIDRYGITIIQINNPAEFWKASHYLIISVSKDNAQKNDIY